MTPDYDIVRSTGSVGYEDILYYATYEVFDHRIEFKVYVAFFYTDGTLGFRGGNYSETMNIAEAEVVLSGSVKWDGCSNWVLTEGPVQTHFCCKKDATDIGVLLGRLYDLAAKELPSWQGD
jgi:hypothetical protein